jgi:hypothetical protein
MTGKRFTGIVLDLEEGMKISAELIAAVKSRYNDILYLDVTIGFDDVKLLTKLRPFVDHFYLQFYDLYTQTQSKVTASVETSPFITFRNDPVGLANWIKTEILEMPGMNKMYKESPHQLYIMWSSQNKASTDCLYPLKGSCGHDIGFGTWTPKAFNSFINLITNNPQYNLFPGVGGHGIFEFDLMPTGWHRLG